MSSQHQVTDLPKNSIVVFDENSESRVGVVLSLNKGKYQILSENGKVVDINLNRLKPINYKVPSSESKVALQQSVNEYRRQALETVLPEHLVDLWELSSEDVHSEIKVELTEEELAKLYYGEARPVFVLGLRIRLIEESFYFKRGKFGFIARDANAVKEMKRASERQKENLQQKNEFANALLTLINTPNFKDKNSNEQHPELEGVLSKFKKEIELLKKYAALGADLEGPKLKEAKLLLSIAKEALKNEWDKIKSKNSMEQNEEAFALLVALKLFTPHQNLALIRHEPPLVWSEEALLELERMLNIPNQTEQPAHSNILDYRKERVFTIDDANTQDIDDGLSVVQSEDGFTVGIHITDVSAFIKKEEDSGSLIDHEAKIRASTIYCPDLVVHMLPKPLSTVQLSLKPGEERRAVSLFINLDQQLKIKDYKFCQTLVCSSKKYSYDEVDHLLEGAHPPFEFNILSQLAAQHEGERMQRGALNFNKKEVSFTPSQSYEERPAIKVLDMNSPARQIVAELMIIYNHLAATLAKTEKIPFPFRTQAPADENLEIDVNNIPDGPAREYYLRTQLKRSDIVIDPSKANDLTHTSLGLDSYCQITSPIRRYLDLVAQRQLVAFISKSDLPYSTNELEELNVLIGESLNRVQQVSRESKRYWLLEYLRFAMQFKEQLTAYVVRLDNRGAIVEIDDFGFTHLIKPTNGLALGKSVSLEVSAVHPRSDFLRLRVIK